MEMGSDHRKNSEKEPAKLGGIQELRTAMKARLRSKPMVEGQEYLDMYVLTRDRARWSRMERQSEETLDGIEQEVKRVRRTLPHVPQTEDEDHGSGSPRQPRTKNFGTFRVDY